MHSSAIGMLRWILDCDYLGWGKAHSGWGEMIPTHPSTSSQSWLSLREEKEGMVGIAEKGRESRDMKGGKVVEGGDYL
jgi:hypothetical protein